MSYHHISHAGNRADIVKHFSLIAVLCNAHYTIAWDAFAAAADSPLEAMATGQRQRLQRWAAAPAPTNNPILSKIIDYYASKLESPGRYPGSALILRQWLPIQPGLGIDSVQLSGL